MKFPDISHHHPVNDWAKAKASCGFLISKATEGQTYIDKTLHSFIKGCEENGIPYWLYTYLRYGNELAQAEFLVNTCKDIVGKHFVGYVLDVEEGNLAARVSKALDYINGLGYKTMIYTMYAQYNSYKEVVAKRPEHCAWWEARYGVNNGVYSDQYPPHNGVDLHQFTSMGVCDGISGRCDLNRIVQKGEDWYKTPLNGDNLTPVEPEEKPVEKDVATVEVTLNVLKNRSRGENVKALQILLNGRGYACGSADGIFGSKTLAAVKKFQHDVGIIKVGIVGKNTWKALLK